MDLNRLKSENNNQSRPDNNRARNCKHCSGRGVIRISKIRRGEYLGSYTDECSFCEGTGVKIGD